MSTRVLLGVLVLLSCSKPSPSGSTAVREKVAQEKASGKLPGLGTKRVSGEVQDLRVSGDGQVLTVLVDGQAPGLKGASPLLRLGELWAVAAAGGDAVKLGNGVTNMPGGWAFSPDSRWILLCAGWDPSQAQGELYVQDAKQLSRERVKVAGGVQYFAASDDGSTVAFVKDGTLSTGPLPSGPFIAVAGEVATAEFSKEGRLYFRRRFGSGGGLYQAQNGAPPKRLVDGVADFTLLPGGTHVIANHRATPQSIVFQLTVFDAKTLKPTKMADDASRFRLSRDGKWLAWRTVSSEGVQDDTGDLWLAAMPTGKPRELGKRVKDFEFAPDSERLVFRANFRELLLGGRDAKPGESRTEKVGDLSVVSLTAKDAAPQLLQRSCPNFLFSPDGKSLAFTARIEKPEVTRRLLALRFGDEKPRAVKDWLYEYQFRPGVDQIFFRADCTREGRSCDWLSLALDSPVETQPTKELERTYAVKFSSDGSRALVAVAHLTDQTYDLAVKHFSDGQQKAIDQAVEWPAQLLGADGRTVAYLVKGKGRGGLYTVDLAAAR